MEVLLLRHHMYCDHGIVMPQTREVDFGGGGLDTYVVFFP